MKRDFHLLIQAVEKKLGKKITLANEVGKLCQRLKKTGKLTPSSLDKLACMEMKMVKLIIMVKTKIKRDSLYGVSLYFCFG